MAGHFRKNDVLNVPPVAISVIEKPNSGFYDRFGVFSKVVGYNVDFS